MNLYAVEYSYADDAEALAEHRPAHRAFLRALLPTTLLAAGAYPDRAEPGALLLVRAESVAQVEEVLNEDPFRTQGLITDRRILLWNPPIGELHS